MSMPKSAAAVVLAFVVAACGAFPGGQGNLPAPSPPTAALAKWKDFPANAKPRPIIAFADTVEHIPDAGFPDDNRKVAWMCNKFVLAPGVTLSATPTSDRISAAAAYAQLMTARATNS